MARGKITELSCTEQAYQEDASEQSETSTGRDSYEEAIAQRSVSSSLSWLLLMIIYSYDVRSRF